MMPLTPILTAEEGMNFWLTLPISVLVTIAFGLLVGLPSLRLRADYFAIATIAFAEAVRLFALNARSLTGGNQGIFGFGTEWAWTERVSIKSEVLYVDLVDRTNQSTSFTGFAGQFAFKHSDSMWVSRIGLNVKLGAPAVVAKY